ncbi:hypothetical protein ABK040_013368 [Willaertia magna]
MNNLRINVGDVLLLSSSSGLTTAPSKIVKYCLFIYLFIVNCTMIYSFQTNQLLDSEPKYDIKITENFAFLPHEIKTSPMILMNFENELHRCFIPKPKPMTKENETIKKTQEDELNKIIQHELFQKYQNSCYFRITGWWIFEFCFNKFVRQFHQEQQKVTMEYFLGHTLEPTLNAAGPSTTTTPGGQQQSKVFKPLTNYKVVLNDKNPEDSYISIPFDKGTSCDLTKQPRTVEIRMYCATDLKRRQLTTPGATSETHAHFIGDIEEPSTCNYLLKFYSNYVCNLEGFSPKKEDLNENSIYCIPDSVINEEENDIIPFGSPTSEEAEIEEEEKKEALKNGLEKEEKTVEVSPTISISMEDMGGFFIDSKGNKKRIDSNGNIIEDETVSTTDDNVKLEKVIIDSNGNLEQIVENESMGKEEIVPNKKEEEKVEEKVEKKEENTGKDTKEPLNNNKMVI